MSTDRVVVLATGGTIASVRRPGGYEPGLAATDLLSAASPDLRIELRDLAAVSSFDLTSSLLLELATEAARQAQAAGIAGVVVTHGTDTMEESAFLTSLVHDGSAPIVFTGAQIPGGDEASDGPANLSDAIGLAADPASRGRGVLISFSGRTLPAFGAQKRSTIDALAFASRHGDAPTDPQPPAPFPGLAGLETRVRLVTSAVADEGLPVRDAVAAGVRGIVLQAFGLGNAGTPTVDAVRQATRRGIVVIVTSRSPLGPVIPRYGGGGGGVDLAAAGGLFAGELSGPQARILLMAALADRSAEDARDLVGSYVGGARAG